MSLKFTKLDLWHINKQTFWTVGPFLDIQNLISCWFIKFLVSPLIYVAFGGKNEYRWTLIVEKSVSNEMSTC